MISEYNGFNKNNINIQIFYIDPALHVYHTAVQVQGCQDFLSSKKISRVQIYQSVFVDNPKN